MADSILTRKDVWRQATDADALVWGHRALTQSRKANRDAGTVAAYVNHGRWVAMCNCNSGMAVSPESDMAICLDCGASHTVTFPPVVDRERIEATLLRRPEATHRNWSPGETVDSLEAETKDRMAREVAELRARANAMAKEIRG